MTSGLLDGRPLISGTFVGLVGTENETVVTVIILVDVQWNKHRSNNNNTNGFIVWSIAKGYSINFTHKPQVTMLGSI